MLPPQERLGDNGTWIIPTTGESLEIEARFVGFGSSRSAYHISHSGEHAPQGLKCQACRWMEIRIFDDGDTFTVSYAGRSEVPGETQRHWSAAAKTEDELVDLLAGSGDRGRFFSKPARQAVESVRNYLPEVGDAYQEHSGHPSRAR